MIIPKGTLRSSLIAYTPIWNKMIWIFLQIIFHDDLKIWSALSFRESKLIANHNKHQIEIYACKGIPRDGFCFFYCLNMKMNNFSPSLKVVSTL